MNASETTHAKIEDISGQETQGEAQAMALSPREKTLRSFKRGGIFFGLAAVSVLVPMLHFVLVPAFLILSGVVFAKTMSETRVVTGIAGSCPSCHQTLSYEGVFKASGTKEVCPHCRQLLRITFDQAKA